jgi:hypothetical protein
MRLRGRAALGGRAVYVVDVDDDRLHALYFDAESGLLVRSGYNRELGDYREVDGVMVPFRVAQSRKGGSSTYMFDTIEHNVAIDTSLFAMPDTARQDELEGDEWRRVESGSGSCSDPTRHIVR